VKRRNAAVSAVAVGAISLGALAGTSLGAGPGNLTIGGMWPLTGALKDFGGPAQKAADLGVAQLNAAAKTAGVDLNVSIVDVDSQTTTKGAQAAASKLVDSDNVSCIAGPMASSEVVAAGQNVTIDAGVPLISPSSTAVDVRKISDNHTIFRVPPADSLQAPVLAAQVRKALGKGPINVAGQNDAYGTGLVNGFITAYKKLGGKVGTKTIFNPEATSYDSEAANIVKGNPKGFVVVTFPGTWKTLAPALVRTGKWKPTQTWGTDGLRSQDLPKTSGKQATEGIRGTVATDKGNTLAPAFQKLWTANNEGKRQTYDAQSFDAAVLCGLAAVKANSTDPAKVAAQIQAVSSPPGKKYTFLQLPQALQAVAAGQDIDYQGASGPIDLGANGDPATGDYVVWSYKGGKLVDGTRIFKASVAKK
jgi:ABC-type branched-subunit amino acid transport system substrate-binding protein